MNCPVQHIPLTPIDFANAAAELAAKHKITVDTNANSGTISSDGATVDWTYDGTTFAYTIVSKPFFISCDHANAAIAEFIKPKGAL